MFGRILILRTAALKPVESLVRKSFLFRPLVQRFVAGDDLSDAMKVAEGLADRGLMSSLDYLGENTKTRAEAEHAIKMYDEIVTAIHNSRHHDKINISIKLTQCGLDIDEDWAEQNYRNLLQHAQQKNTFVRVDMEASEYTERTVHMIENVFRDHSNTGTVLQSYLYRTSDDAQRMVRLGARVRVVKGAYLEPTSVAFPTKAETDAEYLKVAKILMKEGNYPAIATHDQVIIQELKAFADKEGIAKDRFEFQMLYGIRRDLQDGLVAEGYNVRIYIPYGDQWYPYFTRRLAERPANMWFIIKSTFHR
jgi:proline dehydrogenase